MTGRTDEAAAEEAVRDAANPTLEDCARVAAAAADGEYRFVKDFVLVMPLLAFAVAIPLA